MSSRQITFTVDEQVARVVRRCRVGFVVIVGCAALLGFILVPSPGEGTEDVTANAGMPDAGVAVSPQGSFSVLESILASGETIESYQRKHPNPADKNGRDRGSEE